MGMVRYLQNIVTGVFMLLWYVLVNSHTVCRHVDQRAQKNLIAKKYWILDIAWVTDEVKNRSKDYN